MAHRATLDTNVIIYAFDDPGPKYQIALTIIRKSDFLSVQVLNEFANVSRRKRGRDWGDVAWGISRLRSAVPVILDITSADNARALQLARRYQLSVYDALMIAVALAGGATTLYSEDMQHGLTVDDTLQIVNPFLEDARP